MPKPFTEAEAKMGAAGLALEAVNRIPRPDNPDVAAELAAIETWLRRRALGGDKIAIRQAERETGRQVKLR